MICAYDRVYLAQARETLGAMLDYAVWDCKLSADEYFALFVTSGLADRFGRGDPKLISGMSGWKSYGRLLPGRTLRKSALVPGIT